MSHCVSAWNRLDAERGRYWKPRHSALFTAAQQRADEPLVQRFEREVEWTMGHPGCQCRPRYISARNDVANRSELTRPLSRYRRADGNDTRQSSILCELPL